MQRFFEGDVVLENMVGNEKQVLARIYLVTETKEELFSKIHDIKSKLSVIDQEGKNMIVDFYNPSVV